MTNIGWLGLGKLGLPCAIAIDHYYDVTVYGFDPSPDVLETLELRQSHSVLEDGLDDLLPENKIILCNSADMVVAKTDDLVFVAVPTPHDAKYGGEQPMPEYPRDFDYAQLVEAVKDLNRAASEQEKNITIVAVSTVLPGTIRRLILPLLSEYVKLIYNPFFIAMGTTIRDFRNPEFVLLGAESWNGTNSLVKFYANIYHHTTPLLRLSLEEAELAKVSYNTFISLKIIFANTLMEISEHTGANVDNVIDALALGTQRITSSAYMRGGMGDGGACHPRDNIAMSYIAKNLDLSVDPFEFITRAREAQTEWLARQIYREAGNRGLPVVLLGKAYKAKSNLVYGSPALLLAHYLSEQDVKFTHHDRYVDGVEPEFTEPALFVVTVPHPHYADLKVPEGSAIIDPHRFVKPQDGVELVQIGGTPKYWPENQSERIDDESL